MTWNYTNGQLFIDNVLQSDIKDEYIYHEALVHPALSHCANPDSVLILGGAEGCTLREVLKWPVTSVIQVDWSKELCDFFKTKREWSNGSYDDPRVTLLHCDAWEYCRLCNEKFSVIIIDLLDPEDIEPYRILLDQCLKLLKPGGSLAINTGGIWPWNLGAHGKLLKNYPEAVPYKIFVPSFEWEWSFLLFSKDYPEFPNSVKEKTRMFDLVSWSQMITWTRDFFTFN